VFDGEAEVGFVAPLEVSVEGLDDVMDKLSPPKLPKLLLEPNELGANGVVDTIDNDDGGVGGEVKEEDAMLFDALNDELMPKPPDTSSVDGANPEDA
jgi:hypothetical protein